MYYSAFWVGVLLNIHNYELTRQHDPEVALQLWQALSGGWLLENSEHPPGLEKIAGCVDPGGSKSS
jgi:hypothetical protein